VKSLSLRRFDEGGFQFFGEKGPLNISKGALTFVKTKLQENLYRLISDTFVDDSIVDNAVTYSIMTWHRHLGHKSE
jgi:hypothetical protein